MARIGKIKEFQKIIIAPVKKKKAKASTKIAVDSFEKRADTVSGYKFIGEVRVYSFERYENILILDDGSRWAPARNLGLDQTHALYWSAKERVLPRWSGGRMYALANSTSGETSRWIFQGYVENWRN